MAKSKSTLTPRRMSAAEALKLVNKKRLGAALVKGDVEGAFIALKPALARKQGPIYPLPPMSKPSVEARLRQWAAHIVSDLPVDTSQAVAVLALAEEYRRVLIEGRALKTSKFKDHQPLLRHWAMRIASQLPDGEDGQLTLKLAVKLQQDWLPWVAEVPMQIALREELARREAESEKAVRKEIRAKLLLAKGRRAAR